MVYDLVFWLQDPPRAVDPASAHAALMEGVDPPPEVLPFPSEEFVSAVLEAFPDAVREPNGSEEWISWVNQDESESFQVMWDRHHVLVNLRPLNGDRANLLIGIADSLKAPLYDPQTGERFDARYG